MAHVASEHTNAISLQDKAGHYGGTYAHKDVAFEFACGLSKLVGVLDGVLVGVEMCNVFIPYSD